MEGESRHVAGNCNRVCIIPSEQRMAVNAIHYFAEKGITFSEFPSWLQQSIDYNDLWNDYYDVLISTQTKPVQ